MLDSLLQRLDALAVRVKRLFWDKGFAGSTVIAFLTRRQQPAVIACPIRGKTGGTRALCRGKCSYRTTYTFTGRTTHRSGLNWPSVGCLPLPNVPSGYSVTPSG